MTGTRSESGLRALRERYGDALDSEMEAWIGRLGYPRQFPGMLRYQMGYVDERLRPSSHPGKRVRPFLCLAVAEALSGDFTSALPIGAGIELLHNFSLIHDDIEDHDPVRHHRPTVWKVWGEPQAINAGDAMFAVAVRAASSLEDPGLALGVAQQFGDTALALTKGQYLDMSFEQRDEVSADEYIQMISLKSAALIGFSTWAGALVGGGSDRQQSVMMEFGTNLGLALQVYDDINGIWGEQGQTGKQPHTDLINRKRTLPVLAAFEKASGDAREALQRFYSRQDDGVAPVLEVLTRTEARRAVQEQLDSLLAAALENLRQAGLPEPWQSELKEVALEYTGQRDFTS